MGVPSLKVPLNSTQFQPSNTIEKKNTSYKKSWWVTFLFILGCCYTLIFHLSLAQDLLPAPGSLEATSQRPPGTGGAARGHQRPGLLRRCHARLGCRWSWMTLDDRGGLRSQVFSTGAGDGSFAGHFCSNYLRCSWRFSHSWLAFDFCWCCALVLDDCFLMLFGDSWSISWMTDAETYLVARNHFGS